jgi:hypothetical protein
VQFLFQFYLLLPLGLEVSPHSQLQDPHLNLIIKPPLLLVFLEHYLFGSLFYLRAGKWPNLEIERRLQNLFLSFFGISPTFFIQ